MTIKKLFFNILLPLDAVQDKTLPHQRPELLFHIVRKTRVWVRRIYLGSMEDPWKIHGG